MKAPRPDHVKHFYVCFIASALLLIIAQWIRWWIIPAVLLALLLGFAKEIHDIRTTGFDWTDIAADLVGILTSLALFGLTLIGGI